MDIENGEKRRVTTDPFVQHILTMFSDGREVAFRTQRGSEQDRTGHIWIAPVDGGTARQLTKDEISGRVFN